MAKGCSRRKSRGGGRTIEQLEEALTKLENYTETLMTAAQTAIAAAKEDISLLEAAEVAVKAVEKSATTTISTLIPTPAVPTEEVHTEEVHTEEATEGGRRRRHKKGHKTKKSRKARKSKKSKKSQKKN